MDGRLSEDNWPFDVKKSFNPYHLLGKKIPLTPFLKIELVIVENSRASETTNVILEKLEKARIECIADAEKSLAASKKISDVVFWTLAVTQLKATKTFSASSDGPVRHQLFGFHMTTGYKYIAMKHRIGSSDCGLHQTFREGKNLNDH